MNWQMFWRIANVAGIIWFAVFTAINNGRVTLIEVPIGYGPWLIAAIGLVWVDIAAIRRRRRERDARQAEEEKDTP